MLLEKITEKCSLNLYILAFWSFTWFVKILYAITAGIAANKPNAVANKASAIPGATTANEVFLDIAIDWNEFIIPHTVPNKPMKGVVEPIVAK